MGQGKGVNAVVAVKKQTNRKEKETLKIISRGTWNYESALQTPMVWVPLGRRYSDLSKRVDEVFKEELAEKEDRTKLVRNRNLSVITQQIINRSRGGGGGGRTKKKPEITVPA